MHWPGKELQYLNNGAISVSHKTPITECNPPRKVRNFAYFDQFKVKNRVASSEKLG